MANDVKWIKITTDIFDDEKILLIESMPSADSIIVIWFKLLTFAGKQNNDGVFLMSNRIAYTDEMLASIFRREINTVRMALTVFEQFGMIEIVDSVITIPNWNKHQTLDAYEKKKERDRLYQAERRAAQKALVAGSGQSSKKSSDTSPDNRTTPSSYVAVSEEDKEKDKDKEIDIREGEKELPDGKPPAPSIPYESIKNLYNNVCTSFPRCTVMSDARKKAIKARFASGYTMDHFKELFEKAEASSFLKGTNARNWTANFDWLIKDANMAKVLDGNYDDKKSNSNAKATTGREVTDKMKADMMWLERFAEKTANPPKTMAEDDDIRQRAEALQKRLGV